MNRYYITTAIPYANSAPHIGHALELTGADVAARAKRMLGYDVYFQTGTDEHGQKMLESAAKAGRSVREFADEIVPRFAGLWRELEISFDNFVRTTDPRHAAGVTKFWNAVRENGDIYLGRYEGWYSVSEEVFHLESQAQTAPDGRKLSPETGEELVWKSENSYFFRWSRYNDALTNFVRANPAFIAPAFRANEMVNTFLKPGLQDISISRTSIQWGIPVPGDALHVIYVWFDALINYITGAGYGSDVERFAQWWPADMHVVGKDILKFHTLLWPAMLMSAGLDPPRRVFGHGFVNTRVSAVDGFEKMSKSKGNVVDPHALIARFGGNPDPLRYFLMREIDFGQDGAYSPEAMTARYNADLANTLGNLLARTLTMVEKYQDGIVAPPGAYCARDEAVISALIAPFQKSPNGNSVYEEMIDNFRFNTLLADIWTGVSRLNGYITEQQPFKLANDAARKDRLATVLYILCEGLRVIAAQIAPFIPRTAAAIWTQLGVAEPFDSVPFERLSQWGFLRDARVQRGENLFPKI
ncbi:MAG: methionine--tRNA ligase [bacterium]|nr:methionine--tRNA ligase [Candidatus Sumerlaeota bacterium]